VLPGELTFGRIEDAEGGMPLFLGAECKQWINERGVFYANSTFEWNIDVFKYFYVVRTQG